MKYLVDFVIEIMDNLSSSKKVMFQRDGSLYILSNKGFAKLNYGLDLYDDNSLAVLKSKNVLNAQSEEETTFLENEEKYFEPIIFQDDKPNSSLEDMKKIWDKLSILPDDEKIRMVSHDSRYHSHKYGYAVDGEDTWVDKARIIEKETYLESIKQNEENLIKEVERLAEKTKSLKSDNRDSYRSKQIPNCIILTPYIFASIPQYINLEIHKKENWEIDDDLNERVFEIQNMKSFLESPYGIFLTTNLQKFILYQNTQHQSFSSAFSDRIIKQLLQGQIIMNLMRKDYPETINRLNEAHNQINAELIKSFKTKP